MAHLDYHRETFTFASAVPGTVNFDRTVGSLAATTAPLKRKTSNQLCSTNFCLLVLWLLLLPFGFIVKGAAAPALAYALTTTADPARPGQVTQFAMTVTNLSTASQYVTLSYHVPQFTSSGGYVAGTALTYVRGYVAVGATEVVTLDFTVLSGSQTPADGSLITLVVADQTRSASISRTVTVRSAPAAVLALSTPQTPVSPGGSFSYTLAYHNAGAGTLTGAQLSLPVPVGSSFVSADGGGLLGPDGVVRWTLSALAANASGEVNLNLKASTTTGARPPLVAEAALRNSASQILAQASDAKAIYATPPLAYALTTTAGPVQPGQGIQFTVTVTNLSTVSQYVTLNYDVPQFTSSGGYTAGTGLSYVMGYVTAGATQVVSLDFKVLSGTQAPPDGSLIFATVSDRVHGALVSSSVTVRSAPAPVLNLSTPQNPVTPGANFTYTLAYHNGSASTLSGAGLSVPVPVGASFVSADGGGTVGLDGAVHWTLSALAANASGEVNLNLKASTTTGARPPLLVEAALRNSASQILAQASDAKAVYATPPLAYALTATAGPVQPGQGFQFTVTVTNLSTVSQYVTLNYDVPQFTTSGGYTAGTGLSYVMGYVTAGATQVVSLDFTVLSGSQAPPDGSLITAVVSDRVHGGLVSSSLAVRSTPAAVLDLSTPQSPVAPGANFTYTLAYHNGTASTLSGAGLSVPVPVGASFVSADGGGAVGSDGMVHWTLSALAANASGEVNLTLKASTTTGTRPPLLVEAALRNSASQILAQASDAKAVYASPPLAYALTATAGPVQPGQGIEFTVTVTNLSTVSQYVTLNYDVPQFTTSGGYTAGTGLSYVMGYVTAGATQVVSLDFKVLSGSQAPPDGSLITAVVSDRIHGGLVSSSLAVRSTPAANLDLSTPQSPLAPGGNFIYTLAYHNGTASALSGAELTVPVPVGASFVSADGGGAVGSDGAVHWTLSTLAANASGGVNLNLKASTATGARPPVLVEAALRNSLGQILAQASDAKAIYVTPPLSYALTTTADPAQPGQGIEFLVTLTNLSTATQYVTLNYDVPQFTTEGGYAAGTNLSYVVGNVTPGASQVVSLSFTVLSGSQAPPDGSLVTLVVSDRVHGALVSSSLTVRSTPPATLALSTQHGPVTPGSGFAYTLAYHNAAGSALSGAQLTLPLPVGASFVSADGGGKLGSDGAVHWALSALAASATGEVHLNLAASSATAARPPLLLQAALRNSASQILAQASDAKAIYLSPPLTYALTTTTDPARSGQAAQFTVSVTNVSKAVQYVTLNYDVPQFTTDGGYVAGTSLTYVIGNVAVGATQNVTLNFTVLSGSQTPPNGSLITLVVADLTHGATISRSVAVNQTLAMLHQAALFRGELAWAAPATKTGGIPVLWPRR